MSKSILTFDQMLETYSFLTEGRLRWLVRSGQIPYSKMGRRLLFDEYEIDRFLDEIKVHPVKNIARRLLNEK